MLDNEEIHLTVYVEGILLQYSNGRHEASRANASEGQVLRQLLGP